MLSGCDVDLELPPAYDDRHCAVVVGKDRAAVGDRGGSVQHPRHAARRGPAAGEDRRDEGEPLERLHEELREPDGGHQAAHGDASVQGQAATDERDRDQERTGEHAGRGDVPTLQAHREQPRGKGVAARPVVRRRRRGLRADALQDPQPGDQVGGHRGRGGQALLLLLGTTDQRPGQDLGGRQHQHRTHQHRGCEHRRGREEHRATCRQRRRGAREQGDALADGGRPGGVGAGGADELVATAPTLPAEATAWVEGPGDEVEPEVAPDRVLPARQQPIAGGPTRRQEHEGAGDHRQPEHERAGVAGREGLVDGHADHDGNGRLAQLVPDDQQGRAADVAPSSVQRVPQKAPGAGAAAPAAGSRRGQGRARSEPGVNRS